VAWLKESDAAANHPIVLNALEMDDADDRILNECFGFVNRCATQAAAHEKDYIVTVGTAKLIAGSLARYHALIKAAKFCGYFTEVLVEIEGEQRKAFKLVEDNDLFHMMLKSEREWNNQRKKDTRDTGLTSRVRARDGDACRYCGKSVVWGDTKSGRGATYDHTVPGEGGTVDTMVVCCRECNGRRQDDPDSTWRTLPAPAEPLYGPATVNFIAKHGTPVEPSYTRIKTSPVPDDGQQEAVETQPVETPPAATPDIDSATATSGLSNDSCTAPDPIQASQAETKHGPNTEPKTDPGQRSPGSGFVGTGRDGTGQAGKGRQPDPHPSPEDQRLSSHNRPAPRSRRRKRPRNRKGLTPNA
jgi:hypothetical protein